MWLQGSQDTKGNRQRTGGNEEELESQQLRKTKDREMEGWRERRMEK